MASKRVLVVGSINVDLYQKMSPSSVKIDDKTIDVSPVKGMTLPAKNFLENKDISKQLADAGLTYEHGTEEALVLKTAGPFEQKTGGKGANAAAAAGQTFKCELICNFGEASATENKMLLADLKKYGKVDTRRSEVIAGPTGTAYILLFGDNDNAIVLLGGANVSWPSAPLAEKGSKIYKAIEESVAVMLQREVPEYVNVEIARTAKELGKPVFMDVGGTDAPLDEKLIPLLSVVAPNESELTFISGVETSEGGETKKHLVREAVAALKSKFAAVGNNDVEVLVTLGRHGSIHFGSQWINGPTIKENILGLLPCETEMHRFPLGTESGKPKDTTGAGDCFRGSYVAARYGEGWSIKDSMRWASAAGSLAVEVEGAMTSMPSRRAIETRLKGEVSGEHLFLQEGVMTMRVTLKKSPAFYARCALGFFKGVDAKPAVDGKEAVEAQPPVDAIRITGLGNACAVAASVATQVENAQAGVICAIQTQHPTISEGKTSPQLIIDIRKKA